MTPDPRPLMSDTPGKLAAHAYSYEALEFASYEIRYTWPRGMAWCSRTDPSACG